MALEYLRQRDQNIMRNDQFFQSLGLSTLVAHVKGKSARNKDDVPEKSRSLYNPEDDEGSNQHDEDEVSMVQRIVIDHYHFGDNTSIIFGSNSSCLLHTKLLRWVRMYVTRMSNILASSLLEVRKHQREWWHHKGKLLELLGKGLLPIQASLLSHMMHWHLPILLQAQMRSTSATMMKIPFDMNTNSVAVRAACVDMLKGGQRQMRHRLKKYFDGVLANLVRTTSPVTCMTDDQWRALVEMWSNPKHKAAMEAIEAKPMQEGQKSMSSIEIVSKVLPKSSTFLQNVGLPISKPSSRSAVSSQVWELQAQLEAKEQESAQLKQESAQLKQEVASQAHEIDSLKKEQQETHALLRQLILHFNQGQVTPPYNL